KGIAVPQVRVNVCGGAVRESDDAGKSFRVAAMLLRSDNYLAANRRAPVYTQRSLSIQFSYAPIDTRRRRHDTGSLADSLPSRMLNNLELVPTEIPPASTE